MNRNLLTAFGLGAALMVTLAVGRLVGAQEKSTDCAKCASCSGWAMMETKVKDAGGLIDFGKVKNGIACVALAPTPQKGEIVQAAFREFHQIAQFSTANECPMCKDMEKIKGQKGVTWDLVSLPTGVIYMLTSTKPKVVSQIHSMFDRGAEMMKKMEQAHAGCCEKGSGDHACSEKACANHTCAHKKGGDKDTDEYISRGEEEGN